MAPSLADMQAELRAVIANSVPGRSTANELCNACVDLLGVDGAAVSMVLRGTSQGTFDGGQDERFDVAAAIELAEFHDEPELPHRWLVGWSFGTDLALMYGLDPSIAGAILLSPPLRFSAPEHLAAWADSGKPLVALVPELDDYLRPEEARERFSAVPQAEVVAIEGAKHLWVGEPYVRQAHEEIVRRVNPAALPLATTWPAADQQHEPGPARIQSSL